MAVSDLLSRRLVFVALDQTTIVGNASFYDRVVRTVFVDLIFQGYGICRALIARIERAAVEKGGAVLAVPSSVAAEPFYAKLGFIPVRDSYHGEKRNIVMKRQANCADLGKWIEPLSGISRKRQSPQASSSLE